jgi:uncharacterized membrane protein
MTEERLQRLERELELIKQRNVKLEADKAWEASWVRGVSISVMMYLVAAIYLYLVGTQRFWLHAFSPVLGFYLTVRSMPIIKKWWINLYYKNGEDNDVVQSPKGRLLDNRSGKSPVTKSFHFD